MSEATLTKADLDAALAKQSSEYEARIEVIDAKKNEVLSELKELKAKFRANQDFKPEDFHALEEAKEKAEAENRDLKKQISTLTKERENLVKTLEAETAFTKQQLITNGLNDALAAVGVKDAPHLKAVKAMLSPEVEIVVEGDQRVAKFRGKPIFDGIKEWAAEDEAKYFVSARDNTGGGATGGKGGVTGKTASQEQLNSMSAKERAAFFDNGGTLEPSQAA